MEMASSKSFERKMTKSSPRCVTIPASFVRIYGKDFCGISGLRMAGDTKVWNVKVNVYIMKNEPHVSFGTGWQRFMRSNFIFEGDRVQFTLLPNSVFLVKRVTRGSTSGIAGVPMQRMISRRHSLRLRNLEGLPKASV